MCYSDLPMIKEQKEIKDRASLLKQRYLYGTVQSLVNENSSQLNTGTRRGIGRSGVVDKCSVRTERGLCINAIVMFEDYDIIDSHIPLVEPSVIDVMSNLVALVTVMRKQYVGWN